MADKFPISNSAFPPMYKRLHRDLEEKVMMKLFLVGCTIISRFMKFLIVLDSYFLAALNTSRQEGKRHFAVETNYFSS